MYIVFLFFLRESARRMRFEFKNSEALVFLGGLCGRFVYLRQAKTHKFFGKSPWISMETRVFLHTYLHLLLSNPC